ncbi:MULTISPECIES: ABC transporter substrate-binding protein [Vibrio]|uniref:ABC transporter substrate-binding protein n=3 Tax=Vibrio genomosp. F10 TaxID=723171 RepID=A0A1B9R0A2_9VIBR|nr:MULTISPECIES: ABC transporter substrate-binding protein [Vibrio]OCH77069.1 ABC transporter substrate-binding protein [Vibrio genomosp. F10]OEE32718.1 ABC transporter substrate-binding protein [Vibrio genomosp. F10 str. ZF-129]OEE94348.1 ABC transporter substrate-binding protein [Vibrio genomosp. F10 str. 9ZC157]OEF05471.1 ABC transporter substrate-binding protein [Vibrio genomosp. F10 str. 9ZB36]WGV98907.1 ABC transporter substrate-binding protein [Vibrio sp. YMD68]
MNMKLAALLLLATTSTAANANECGSVTIADMNWSSASLIANIDKFILEHGYDCDAELIPGDTMPTGTSMIEKGQPDIAPEFWSNAMKEALDKGVAEKRLRYAGKSLVNGGEEGFWVPQYLVDKHPEMATIEGVIKHAKMFEHPESKDVSAFYSCPAGWNCQISAGNLFKALKLEDAGFEIVDPGSSAGLSGAIAKAYAREEAWFGYYWAPTAVLGKYNMVKVDFGSGVDLEEFVGCTTKEECESPKPTMYPPSPVHTMTTEAFASKAPEAYAYLGNRGFTNEKMNELLAWMEDNQADGEEGMYHFLSESPEIWHPWVSAEIAKKVENAL